MSKYLAILVPIIFVMIFLFLSGYNPKDGAVENYYPDLWDNTLR